jgi:hypothetical protein
MMIESLFMEHLFLDPGQFREGCLIGCPRHSARWIDLSRDQLAAANNAIPATFPWQLGYGIWRAAQHAAIQQLELTVRWRFGHIIEPPQLGLQGVTQRLALLRTPLKPSQTTKPR